MDWLKRMNRILDYIESHLDEEIDYDKISRIALCTPGLFQRIFAHLTQMSLSEYIRRRKLSKAGIDLKTSHEKIIDIAFKYGYESSDSFSYAFKKLHGVSPSQARCQDIILKSYPKLTFVFALKGDEEMNYKLLERDAIRVIGKSIITTMDQNLKENTIPLFWKEAHVNGTVEKLCHLVPNQPLLGICSNINDSEEFRYLIGVESKNRNDENLEEIIIPKSTWAIFEVVGPLPESVQKLWVRIFTEFLPNENFVHAKTPDFELYYENDGNENQFRSEIWIPVLPKQ